jgi:YidC/Oxa1 family membrane protein insertase
MSQPQGGQRSSFVQILLFASIAYLGFMLIFPRDGSGSDARSSEEVWQAMQKQNAGLLDLDIQKNLAAYRSKLAADAKAGRLKEAERSQKELQAVVLAADTEFKSGIYHGSHAKIDRAYMTLRPQFEALRLKPVWKALIPVAPAADINRPQASISPESLYDDLVVRLAADNRTHLVIGIFPGHAIVDFLVNLTGARPWLSYWLACFIMAAFVRICIWPFAAKQYAWGRQVSQLKPYLEELKKANTDKKTGKIKDPQQYQQDTMQLYKEYGINPLAGCGPMFIQMPFFLIIYQFMLMYRFEFTKGHFLWIQPSAGSFLGLPLAPNMGERDIWIVVVYTITMVGSTLLTPVSDPSNARNQRLIGVGMSLFFSITIFFWPTVPSAFIIYWIFANLLGTSQALYAYSRPMAPLQKVQSMKGGLRPDDGPGGAAAIGGGAGPKQGGGLMGWFERLQESMQQKLEEAQSQAAEAQKPSPSAQEKGALPIDLPKKAGLPRQNRPKKKRPSTGAK